MAAFSVFCQFPRVTPQMNCLNPNLCHRPSEFVPVDLTFRRHALIGGFAELRPVFKVRAMDEAESEPENAKEGSEIQSTKIDTAEGSKTAEEIERLKSVLVDSIYGTDRGMKSSSETRAEISEIISQLEAKNPTKAPTEELSLFNGKWIIAYTSVVGTFPLLSCCKLPWVKVEEISQTIDTENLTDENTVRFAGLLTTTSISTSAKLEVRSPKRVQMKFLEGVIGTPQLKDRIETPETVEWSGKKIDLKPIRGLLTFVQDTASAICRTISSQPPLKFSLENANAESWIITTYLDKDLRISRGDGGCVFVHLKEGSSLLNP